MRISIRGRVLLVSACILAGPIVWAQQNQRPIQPAKISTDLGVTFSMERSQMMPNVCCFWFKGAGADAAVTFWKGLGVAASLTGDHVSNIAPGVDVNKIGFLGGPRYTWTAWRGAQDHRVTVYGQGLFGLAHGFDGLYPSGSGISQSANSLAIQAGGGLNYSLNRNWGVRLIEADFVQTELPNAASNAQNALRLSFGLTYHIGVNASPAPVTLSLLVNPSSIFPGDPVTVTATAGSLDTSKNNHVVYNWNGTGVTGNGASAQVATASLTPGTYTVKASVKEGKEGLKSWQSAEASASFTVKAFEPPTIGCSANPSVIKPGETSTVTANGVSPQNRPLTYSFASTSGSISGMGATATFNSAGAPTGSAAITCNTTDDKGQTATASTSVTITAAYVAPMPHTQPLCSISFAKDKQRPTRVDNEAKACLDEVALDLQKQPDAKAVIVGSSDAREKAQTAKQQKAARKNKHAKVENLAAERAVNTKDYLVTEKGIDATRISVATGASDVQQAEDYLVPSGTSFSEDIAGTIPVDESAVKPQPRQPLAVRPAHKMHTATAVK